MRFVSLRELKINPSGVVDRLAKEDVVVTRKGKPAAALVYLDEDLLDEFVLLHHPTLLKEAEAARSEYRRKGGVGHASMRKRSIAAVDRRELVYAPRAQRDLRDLPKADALRVLDDLELLQDPPWPPGKVKKLRGHDLWEIKTGDFRTLFWPQGRKVVILRVVLRRDLEAAIGRIDVASLLRWLRERPPG